MQPVCQKWFGYGKDSTALSEGSRRTAERVDEGLARERLSRSQNLDNGSRSKMGWSHGNGRSGNGRHSSHSIRVGVKLHLLRHLGWIVAGHHKLVWNGRSCRGKGCLRLAVPRLGTALLEPLLDAHCVCQKTRWRMGTSSGHLRANTIDARARKRREGQLNQTSLICWAGSRISGGSAISGTSLSKHNRLFYNLHKRS